MKTNQAGIDLIKQWEGFRSKAYLCPADVWTIGYGHTQGVKPDDTITEPDAAALLIKELSAYEDCINSTVKVSLNANQFSALVSFCYNVGISSFANSTLLKMLNRKDYSSAGQQLLVWNKVKGQTMPGLTRRRKDEKALFELPV